MLTVFRYAIGRSRGQIIGWGITLLALGLLMVSFYDTIAQEQEKFSQLLEAYPKELMAFFGDFAEMATPKGYLGVEYFSFKPLLLGVFAVLAGSGLLSPDEEAGRMDFILGQPVSRTALFGGRLLAFLATSLVICALGWLGIVIPMGWSQMDLGLGDLVLPFVSLLSVLILFGSLSLLLSLVLPARRLAAMLGGVLLAASFFITGLSRMAENLKEVARLSPLTYYQGGDAIDGLNLGWIGGLLGASLVFALLAWWRFSRRDIRVGGEGGWRLPLLRRRGVATRED